MYGFLSFANKTKSYNAINVLKKILNKSSTKEFLIKLNTEDQLFLKGEDSRGIRLDEIGGGYSANTIEGTASYEGKKSKGQPIDRVTLKDTGEFYDSWQIKIELPYIIFIADDVKDGVKLTDEWGINIIGLNEENKRKVEGFLLEEIIKDILSIF